MRATSRNSGLLGPSPPVTRSKARRSGPSAIFGRVFVAEAVGAELVLAQRIADRGAQDVGALGSVSGANSRQRSP